MTQGRRLLLGLILLLFISCGVAWSKSGPEQLVNILMPASFADASSPLVDRFNSSHKGSIRLQITKGPLQTDAISDLAISSLLLGNSPYDALLMDVTWLPKYAEAGWLEPLDTWFDASEQDLLQPGARLGNSYDGQLYRWPLVADVGLLYWRTDLIDAPPTTPDELSRISRELQMSGSVKEGFVWQGRQYEGLSCDYLEVLNGFGGHWLDPTTGRPDLSSPAALAAASWLESLIRTGVSPQAVTNYAESESLQSFKSGDAAFMRNWPYAYAELQKQDSSVRGKVAVTTMVAEPGETPRATLGSWGLSVLKGSPHRDAAIEAIRFITSEQAQRERFRNQGYTPTLASLFQDPEMISMSPVLPDVDRALALATVRPASPLYAQLSDVLQRRLSAIFTGQQSVDNGMEEAQSASDVILLSAGGA